MGDPIFTPAMWIWLVVSVLGCVGIVLLTILYVTMPTPLFCIAAGAELIGMLGFYISSKRYERRRKNGEKEEAKEA